MRLAQLLCFFLLFPAPLFAGNGISCHCFQDRAYNPDKPGAADAYLLATTQNSFISELFDIPKKALVAAKMSGTDGDDLWLAGYVASRTGQTMEQILELRRNFSGWNELLVTLDGLPEWLDPALAKPILAQQPLAKIVSALVDLQVEQRLQQTAVTINRLRRQGAIDQELILVALLSQQTGSSAETFYAERRNQSMPWDMLLHQLGIEPQRIDDILGQLLN